MDGKPPSNEKSTSIDRARADAQNVVHQSEQLAGRYRNEAASLNLRYTLFSFIFAILSVATPVLVTLQGEVQEVGFRLFVIIIASIGGASATLEARFRWGERTAYKKLAAMEFNLLHSNLAFKSREIEYVENPLEVYKKLRNLHEYAIERMSEIMRTFDEKEIGVAIRGAQQNHSNQEDE